MSAIQTQVPRGVHTSEAVFSISVERYHEMIDRGILTPDDPVELLEGVLVFKMPKKPFHRISTEKVREMLRHAVGNGWSVMSQEPVTLADGEPEPDAQVYRGVTTDYVDRHPGSGDVAIVVEVAESSLSRDRGIKLRSYARAGIPVYWIVNLIDRVVEVYTDPDPLAEPEPTYRNVTTFKPGDAVPVVVAGQNVGSINVSDILP